MNYFFYKPNPPRSTFPADMTPAEGELMREHVAYWIHQMNRGFVVALGPVADPKGHYGIGIIRLDEGADPYALGTNDPVICADAGFSFEIHAMPRLMLPQEA